ncbi:MAG: class I SAM-dependent methyltransferase [Sandaracinaceae bacterium]|jgi:SAM-dependent methyltransferase|nr:class I SAM-dependent methyltransferase [Sandaracinaceae bacterium]
MTLSSKQFNLLSNDVDSDERSSTGDLSSAASRIIHAFRSQEFPTDRVFDRVLPRELQVVSGQHWTPIEVVVRAVEWLEQLNVQSVVDIGSGAGKFCVAAALAGRARFIGVEQRLRLVEAATDLAHVLGVDARVSFVHGRLGETRIPEADAYYLYNPFGENFFRTKQYLDEEVELSNDRYHRDVAIVEQLLRDAPFGTCLLTYNGFGGSVPSNYREIFVDRDMPNVLHMWRKT